VPEASASSPEVDETWAQRVRDQSRAQWGHDPAGALHAGDTELGTPESFASIERSRYEEQAWMHDTFRYDRFRGAQVLEIGVGLGTDHLQFARAGAEMTGVDLTPRCVDMTGHRLALEGLRSNLHVMDAERLEFPDDSFDVVYSFGVLHHVPSSERAFAEVRRVLRPGGVFLGGLYSRESFHYARMLIEWMISGRFLRQPYEDMLSGVEYSTSDARPYVRLFTREELRSILHATGFEEVAIRRRHLGLGEYTASVPRGIEQLFGRIGGWYVVHEAR
jgi:SAM-dependent methyltransferase